LVVSSAPVGQPLELIELVPAPGVSPTARVRTPAVTPVAVEVDGVETCVPGCPVSDQVARIPENAIAQLPVFDPDPEPDPDPDPDPDPVPFEQTLCVPLTTQV
jgi:hypothetical protein